MILRNNSLPERSVQKSFVDIFHKMMSYNRLMFEISTTKLTVLLAVLTKDLIEVINNVFKTLLSSFELLLIVLLFLLLIITHC